MRTGSTPGCGSVFQVVMILALVAGGYLAVKYGPVQLRKMTIAGVARKTAAKMMVEFDDAGLQRAMRDEVQKQTGVEIGYSELFLTREREGNVKKVEVRWTEQIDHLWGSTHTLEMVVVETAEPGPDALRMRNAD